MATVITPGLLQAVGASVANAAIYAPLLEAARVVSGDAFNTISSKTGIAMLVAQTGHESGGFSTTSEDLTYSQAALLALPKYFTPAQAYKYGYIKDGKGGYSQLANQVAIANLYYGGRLGNLGVNTNDGWLMRGGGLIQNTGRANFSYFGITVGLTAELAAEYARTPAGAVKSALWFWRANKLIVPASMGDVTACTQIIQGAAAGLADRVSRFKAALSAIG